MNWNELHEIEERIARLTPEERLHLIERLARSIRMEQFTDHAAIEKGLEEMAKDPAIQNELELWRKADSHAAG